MPDQVYESPEAWRDAAVALFGENPMQWRFVCPSCGHVASVQDWKDAGATEGEVAFSCVGRHVDAGEFATKPHHTHACQHCGMVWRPALVPTVGVQFLPGFKDEEKPKHV